MPQDGWIDVELPSSGGSGWMDVPEQKQYQDDPSMLSKVMSYDVPLIDITPATNWLSKKYEEYSKPRQMSSFEQSVLRGFPGMGMIQDIIDPGQTGSTAPFQTLGSELIKGTGEVASGLTTPSNIVATAASGGAYGAARAGLPAAAKALTWGARAASVPTTIHGAQTVAGAENWQDVGMGLGEMAGGLAGTFEPIPRLRPKTEGIAPKVDIPQMETPSVAPELEPPVARMPSAEKGPDGLRDVIVKSNWSPGEIQYLKQQGFVSGGVSPQGLPYMIRKGVEDPYTGGLINEPQATPEELMDQLRASVQNDQVAAVDRGIVPFNEEEGFTLPKESVTKARIEALELQGYEQVGLDDAGNSIFKRFLEDESGGLVTDPQEWMRLIANRGKREILEGEPRGRVAQFEDPRFGEMAKSYDNQVITRAGQESVRMMPEIERNIALEELEARLGRTPSTEPALFDYTRPKRVFDEFDMPQEMRVPNVRESNIGLENVAIGGADPRVLDVLGSSLYSRPRPVVTVKELLQNAFDEHKISGISEPVRVVFNGAANNPVTGVEGRALTVRDRGRGLNPEEIYTVLTDLGKTGKAGIESAAGGFGFAKAAPFLGGQYVNVTSVVDTPTGRMRYNFAGKPSELKNQVKGVPLNGEIVGPEVPTGLEITTHYDTNTPGWYDSIRWAQHMTEASPSVPGGIKLVQDYGGSPTEMRAWLDENPLNPINKRNMFKSNEVDIVPNPNPTLQDTINTPGADIDIRYDITPGREASELDIHLANKGMYQGTIDMSYGDKTPNVPSAIVADIKAIVEEGHPDYPFAANREQINRNVQDAIQKWVKDNIVSGVHKKRIAAIQKQYDSIKFLNEESGSHNMYYFDEGNRFTPEEIAFLRDHPKLNEGLTALEYVNAQLLAVADTLGWQPQVHGAKWTKPSERLKKFGLLIQAPNERGVTMGIHIPRPDDMESSAILINLFEHLQNASKHLEGRQVDQLVTDLFTTMAHEQAHIPGGSHDQGFAYRDAELRAKMGELGTIISLRDLREAFSDGRGNISPELSEVLSVYNESRGRKPSREDALLATGIGSQRRSDSGGGAGQNFGGSGGGKNEPPAGGSGRGRGRQPPSALREAYNLPRAATTTADLSAAMRQGLPLIFRKEWWTSWNQQLQALGSEGAYQKTLSDLRSRPIFQSRIDMSTGKVTKSFAEQVGMPLSDVTDNLTRREESVASNWIESGKMFGPLAPVYQKTLGRVARASNRAYTAFLNQLRADTFEALLRDAEADFNAGTKGAKNPYTDLTFAREIADFVNTATGRGPLRTALPTIEGGRIGLKERSLEQNAKLLTDTIFSPRLMASRVRMLNPATYIMASPFVRKQYAKALLSVAAASGSISALAAGAGADVSLDPNSADFGKIRIGDTRIDTAAGFQQYLVAASRLISGRTTSSSTGTEHELGQGYRAETRKDVGERFLANKLHPVLKFAYDLAFASEYQPFHVGDRTIQMFVPLIVQDVVELASQDPDMIPLIGPIAIGMGTQTYGKGESVSKFISPENDFIFTGGAPENEMSNLWGEE